jgi:hypothetical protein
MFFCAVSLSEEFAFVGSTFPCSRHAVGEFRIFRMAADRSRVIAAPPPVWRRFSGQPPHTPTQFAHFGGVPRASRPPQRQQFSQLRQL